MCTVDHVDMSADMSDDMSAADILCADPAFLVALCMVAFRGFGVARQDVTRGAPHRHALCADPALPCGLLSGASVGGKAVFDHPWVLGLSMPFVWPAWPGDAVWCLRYAVCLTGSSGIYLRWVRSGAHIRAHPRMTSGLCADCAPAPSAPKAPKARGRRQRLHATTTPFGRPS